MQTHPDQAENIYEHQTEINEMWNALTIKVSDRCQTSLMQTFTVKVCNRCKTKLFLLVS